MIASSLILISALLFLVLAWKNFHLAVCLLIACLPSFIIRSTVLGLPFTFLEVMILVLFLVFLIKNRLGWLADFKKNQFFWPLMAILLTATVSVFVSPDLRQAAGLWKAYFIEPIMFFIILISTTKSQKQLRNIFWALGVSAVYLSLFAIWQKFSGWGVPEAFLNPDGSVDRVVSILAYPNALGLYLGPIIVLFTGFFWQGVGADLLPSKRIIIQSLKLLVVVVSFVAIILAKSEGAMLAVAFVWLLFGLANKKTRLLAGAVVVAAVVIFFTNSAINQYLVSKITLQDYSGFIRRLIWQESWQMLKGNWFWGAGLAGYQFKIAPYHLKTFEIYLYPHNIVLNFWSELGLLGCLSFVWLFVVYFKTVVVGLIKRQGNRVFSITLALVGVEIIIHGLVDVPYFKNDLAVLFWLIAGLAVLGLKLEKLIKT